MPHQCTNCDRTFDDGSKEMLSGCPDCGGNTFQFKPDGAETVDTTAEPPDPPEPSGSSVAKTVGRTAATVKDLVSSGSDDGQSQGDLGSTEPGSSAAGRSDPSSLGTAETEDSAQATARSDIVSPDELPASGSGSSRHQFEPVTKNSEETQSSAQPASASGRSDDESVGASTPSESAGEEASEQRPDLQELREELNDQFESIKVHQPGQYELNLMELYDREEYIIALEEDGRYSIQVPENFRS